MSFVNICSKIMAQKMFEVKRFSESQCNLFFNSNLFKIKKTIINHATFDFL